MYLEEYESIQDFNKGQAQRTLVKILTKEKLKEHKRAQCPCHHSLVFNKP